MDDWHIQEQDFPEFVAGSELKASKDEITEIKASFYIFLLHHPIIHVPADISISKINTGERMGEDLFVFMWRKTRIIYQRCAGGSHMGKFQSFSRLFTQSENQHVGCFSYARPRVFIHK